MRAADCGCGGDKLGPRAGRVSGVAWRGGRHGAHPARDRRHAVRGPLRAERAIHGLVARSRDEPLLARDAQERHPSGRPRDAIRAQGQQRNRISRTPEGRRPPARLQLLRDRRTHRRQRTRLVHGPRRVPPLLAARHLLHERQGMWSSGERRGGRLRAHRVQPLLQVRDPRPRRQRGRVVHRRRQPLHGLRGRGLHDRLPHGTRRLEPPHALPRVGRPPAGHGAGRRARDAGSTSGSTARATRSSATAMPTPARPASSSTAGTRTSTGAATSTTTASSSTTSPSSTTAADACS